MFNGMKGEERPPVLGPGNLIFSIGYYSAIPFKKSVGPKRKKK